jgi:hypothetical protein
MNSSLFYTDSIFYAKCLDQLYESSTMAIKNDP